MLDKKWLFALLALSTVLLAGCSGGFWADDDNGDGGDAGGGGEVDVGDEENNNDDNDTPGPGLGLAVGAVGVAFLAARRLRN